MRCLALTLTLLVAATGWAVETKPRPISAAEIAFLKEALKNTSQDVDHWAYTETTTVKASKGRPRLPTIVRFDPSKPYAEQYTVVSKGGKPPSEREIRKYREKGEKRGESRRRAAEAAAARKEGETPAPKVDLGATSGNLDQALVVEDSAGQITFEVPVKSSRQDFPVENLQILVQVNKQKRQIEKAFMHVKKSFRVKLLAKINAGSASVEFKEVDPNFGPVMTTMTGNFGVSFLAIPVDADVVTTRTEWRRVKAFDERFSVKMAPLQMLGF